MGCGIARAVLSETCGFCEDQAVGRRQVFLTSAILGLTEDPAHLSSELVKDLLCVSCWGHEGEEEDSP